MAKQSAQTKNTGVWTSTQSYVLALITLVVGIGIGWLVRGSFIPNETVASNAPAAAPAASNSGSFQVPSFGQSSSGGQRLSPEALSQGAAPMLAQLKDRPNDPDLLARIGNFYYDSQAYPQAIEYYQESLALRPRDPDVTTDMGTAMWYSGDADGALKEFDKSLSYSPTHNETLFNRGVVLMQGKNDPKGAVASWQTLLKINPNYPERVRVKQLIAQAQQAAK
jgi:tetratricopeptide (TPR) repeat protein